jgi:AcrR family transcriptional regulator
MSEMKAGPRRRADAVRSRAAVLEACLRLLDSGEDPSIGRIAGEAGVTRQTVYAHFDSRDDLLRTVAEVLTQEVAAGLATTDPGSGELTEAIDRWCRTVWRVLERRPALLNPVLAAVPADAADVVSGHELVIGELRALVRRARRERSLPRELTVDWLVRAVLAHGHAVGEAVGTGSLSARSGAVAFRHGVRGLLLGAG